ncbi:Slt2p [Saccharomyces cerevisiae x Saccharomyces kudriavzevii VIN7]|uniref:Mitogen-activated protein kinase n=1 Tax=Saccharomyces cerevisiae x Saccharomyces kudriavzevii (strain VIN7) TaxID=1095631 RepID=H0GVN9_SACCK|nr:Slt2p [Saccharomyces cerevisiae x Saccharomyces kudriavzevii VIN7]
MERHTFKVFNQDFSVDKRFQLIKEIGHGAYGIVCSARFAEAAEDTTVAIKKVTNVFSKTLLCKRSLRELKLLRHFRGHKNITCLYDMDIVFYPDGSINGLYLYEELMECDMHQIIKSGQPLTDAHYQSFTYQILCGLKYIHSADVLHRDLKPGNLLVNADCQLKICDFGLARGYSENPVENSRFLTEYVATRWYRAPEIMLSYQGYTKAIDVWSAGCILAEFLGGKPVFKGKDYVNQLNQILQVLGTPPDETLKRIGSKNVQDYIHQLGFIPKVPFVNLYPNANSQALDLLEKMLAFDPQRRITVDEALEHPYLSIWHDPADEPVCSEKFEFSFESVNDMEDLKQMVIQEVQDFRRFVRQPLLEEQKQQRLQQQQQQQQQPISNADNGKHGMGEENYSKQMAAPSNPVAPQQESFGIHSQNLPRHDTDFPPRPQESLMEMRPAPGTTTDIPPQDDNDTLLDLERELEFGLDRKYF